MARPLRHIPFGGALVEITIRAIHGRYLLRPDRKGQVNETVIGVLARAQRLYSMSVIAVCTMSSHMHLLVFAEDADQLSSFMGYIKTNLSKEIGRLHDWPGPLWERRYRGILISHEEDVQVDRLKYILSQATKAVLVDRPIQWPGVHVVRSLLKGDRLFGWWFDRTREFAATRRGERPGRYEYAEQEELKLDPLPCWAELPEGEIRRRVRDLVREIEKEAAAERHETGKESIGAEAVMDADPHFRPRKLKKSPAPPFHAWHKSVRKAMWQAYAWVVAEHREASERLRAGDRDVRFPEGTFPPRLPFVPFACGHPP